MKTKVFKINGKEYTFLKYKNEWVIPIFEIYSCSVGAPISMKLYSFENGDLEYNTSITVNIPECDRKSGCQFIDINNNDAGILNWLEENKFGKRTGKVGHSGFCSYPEFNFYSGEKFMEYRILTQDLIHYLID